MTWISMDPLSRAIARSASPLLILLVLVVGISCGDDAPAELDSVVFMAGFKAQANLPFVAAYVAQEQGYFEEQGLAVEIKHAGSGEHLKLLMSGDVDFTTAAASSPPKRAASSTRQPTPGFLPAVTWCAARIWSSRSKLQPITTDLATNPSSSKKDFTFTDQLIFTAFM